MLPYSCVCFLTPGLPDASRQAVGPDTQADAAAGSFCTAKQTKAKTAGVAETHRARETGKPGHTVRPRGKAAWPHARRTVGPFSPVTREAEQGRLVSELSAGLVVAIRRKSTPSLEPPMLSGAQ